MATGGSVFGMVSGKISKVAALLTSITAIIGAIVGVCTWISSQFQNAVSAQIADFRAEVKASDTAQNQAITRLELMNLMQNDPTNIAGIEKMARYYFQELNGDLYLTAKYSDWAKQYGGDISIVVGTHQ